MIVALRRAVVLEVPMMVVVVVGVRGDGDRVVRGSGGHQVDRRRRPLAPLLLLAGDDGAQVTGGGGGDGDDVGGTAVVMMMMVMMVLLLMVMMVVMVVVGRGAGRFRAAGAVLAHGAHRAYDQRRYGLALHSIGRPLLLVTGRPPIARIPRARRRREGGSRSIRASGECERVRESRAGGRC